MARIAVFDTDPERLSRIALAARHMQPGGGHGVIACTSVPMIYDALAAFQPRLLIISVPLFPDGVNVLLQLRDNYRAALQEWRIHGWGKPKPPENPPTLLVQRWPVGRFGSTLSQDDQATIAAAAGANLLVHEDRLTSWNEQIISILQPGTRRRTTAA